MTKLPFTVAVMTSLVLPLTASAEDVPDALSVEWQGKKPCEGLHEDDQIRVLRCTFPPVPPAVEGEAVTSAGEKRLQAGIKAWTQAQTQFEKTCLFHDVTA